MPFILQKKNVMDFLANPIFIVEGMSQCWMGDLEITNSFICFSLKWEISGTFFIKLDKNWKHSFRCCIWYRIKIKNMFMCYKIRSQYVLIPLWFWWASVWLIINIWSLACFIIILSILNNFNIHIFKKKDILKL